MEIIGLVLVFLGLCLIGLAVRRRWVARNGGTFECSMRRHVRPAGTPADASVDTTTPSTNWVLGVARYSGENLEWFRFFSLAWWPKYTFRRSDVTVVDHRTPTATEAVALYADQEIVTLAIASATSAGPRARSRARARGDVGSVERDLAMTPDSLTGMLSWLEAAPPGIGRY
ncbi:DUF2550 family protein [Microlunatus elymi]|uniref:DUF2550 family protein n=1 Tax=Microlunatus elymi TaxID=2596828 RepID=A0A516Q0T8_9ACTN|nr:DUF2550 domain-containing protein [Microlunatus elymi]QDP97046.1 DUF2550 family protein [Microlunatus elymi]